MDMQKIGAFLATLRKEQHLTQEELSEKIGVTNKTVSRWENGNYLPPVEILQMLSKMYDVGINEILCGERLSDKQYKENAEEAILSNMLKNKYEAKKKIIIAITVSIITIIAGVAFILLAGLIDFSSWLRITLIALSALIIVVGIGVCCVLTVDAGVYECPHCGEKFVPTMKGFICGVHTFSCRRLKCPKCGKKSFCKKRLG